MENKENPQVEQLHHPESAAVVDDQNEDKGAGQRALLAQKLKQTWVALARKQACSVADGAFTAQTHLCLQQTT